jgi:cytochrome c oxidase assembly protein subunit 15
MQAQSLVDWAPALEVALLGAVLALGPAAVVYWRGRRLGLRGWAQWQRVLTVATLFLTLDLILFGAFTRLTDSGLGCPDWPGCYGELSPFQAREDIAQAHAAAPHGPVSPAKAWIEMVHRYLATGVGALITALMALAWWHRRAPGALSPWWSTATFAWVCVQGAFGAFTVTLKLQPLIVTLHLLGALLGVMLLTAQARKLGAGPSPTALDAGCLQAWCSAELRPLGWGVMALLLLQIATGAWVSTNYAVLACAEFPTCQGQWWPDMDLAQGFRLWRPLGGDGEGGVISMAALTAIHMVHRGLAMVVALVLLAYAWALSRWQPMTSKAPPWRGVARGLALLVFAQVATGLSNVVLDWPLAAALAHTLGAALLVWWLTRLLVVPQGLSGARLRALDPVGMALSRELHPDGTAARPQRLAHAGLHGGRRRPSAS